MCPTMLHRLKRGCLIFWFLTAVTGCHSLPQDRSDISSLTSSKPHLLYLHRSPHASLYVEVDAVEGTAPSDLVLAQLKDFLSIYCDKPEGITVARGRLIPRAEAVGYSPEGLASRFLKGPPEAGSNSPPAFIEILYFDGRLCPQPTSKTKGPIHQHRSVQADAGYSAPRNPRATLRPFPGFVAMDRRYFTAWPKSLEGLLLIHEAGHVLGLTQNGAHGTNIHCLSANCLMQPAIRVGLWQRLFGGHLTTQTNLCEKCRADLMAGREAEPEANLRFAGGAFVRSEEDYHIISQPAFMKLFVGDISHFDVKTYRQEFRTTQDRTEPTIRELIGAAQVDGAGTNRAEVDAGMMKLEQSTVDKDPFVRRTSRRIVAHMQMLIGQWYLEGNGPPKDPQRALHWFRKAAEGGDAEGQRKLGHCLAQGIGSGRDVVAAFEWLSLAADQLNGEAMKERDSVARGLRAEEIAEAKARATAFKQSLAKRENEN